MTGIQRAYEAWCSTCQNHWHLRLYGVTDPTPVVRCPQCGCDGIANVIEPSA